MRREEIARKDFPTSRKGYDREAVDAHLREIADSVGGGRASADSSRAEAAGEKVTEIIELAERKAAEIEEEARREAGKIVEGAEAEARRQVERAQEAVTRLISQADELRLTVGSLGKEITEELHGNAEAATAETEPAPDLVPEPAPPQPEIDPGPVTVPEPTPPREPEPEPPLIPEPAPPGPEAGDVANGSLSTEELVEQLKAGEAGSSKATSTTDNGDLQAARLVAMNMALNGSPRAEIAKHLLDDFGLADSGGLLDEVYARVETGS